LRRLLAFRVHNEAETDDVAVRVPLEKQRRYRKERVEPAPCLVDRLRDEIRRESCLELFDALARIAPLGERHRPGVEPGVENLRDALHRASAFLAWEGDRVDVGPVEIGVVGEADLGGGADAPLLLALLADPDRD